MVTPPEKGPLWWDRDSDRMGRAIRADVRAAAHEIWGQACSRARAVLGDDCDAAEMMEVSVERVSHYLDRQGAGPYSENAAGLLTTAFRRQVQKRRLKKDRLELVGGTSELDQWCRGPDWSRNIDRDLDLKKIIRRLSRRSNRILLRRRDGIDWKSISEELGISEQTAQNSFWREVRQAQVGLLTMHRDRRETPTGRSSTGGEKETGHEEKSPFKARRKGRGHRTGTD
jgi:DNA-binding NarL/FixJ family response regulator